MRTARFIGRREPVAKRYARPNIGVLTTFYTTKSFVFKFIVVLYNTEVVSFAMKVLKYNNGRTRSMVEYGIWGQRTIVVTCQEYKERLTAGSVFSKQPTPPPTEASVLSPHLHPKQCPATLTSELAVLAPPSLRPSTGFRRSSPRS